MCMFVLLEGAWIGRGDDVEVCKGWFGGVAVWWGVWDGRPACGLGKCWLIRGAAWVRQADEACDLGPDG